MKTQLVDARNWSSIKADLINEIQQSGLIGFDIETQDSDRHQGLNDFMKANSKRLVFDVNRTVITGFSWHCDGGDTAYYLNLYHADVENRIPWHEARQILDAKPADAHWICHNAPFEITMMRKSLGYELKDVICTLQMAVSTFNEDQYPIDDMLSCGFGGIQSLLVPISRAFQVLEDAQKPRPEQAELIGQVLSKTSIAGHSYNGLVRELSYGYGLKALSKRFLGYDQTEFKTVLGDKEHMGELTGEEVCSYGADDAWTCVKLLHKFLPLMAAQNEDLINTFFAQENPMIYVYSDIWAEGLKIDQEAVEHHLHLERKDYAEAVRSLHSLIAQQLPYPTGDVMFPAYREKLTKWATTPLPDDPFDLVYTTAGPVSTNWATEKGLKKSPGPNLSYYMAIRSILYDLFGFKVVKQKGKVGSDAKARAKIGENNPEAEEILTAITKLAGIEQRMKLYINPYRQLLDPDTHRVYPVVSSKLNSRRMAMSNPNGMQLAKRGESVYIRGLYLPDQEDHVIVSIDWSQVELVLIGELSGDPGFADAYGQLPYKDLHRKAVADILKKSAEDVTKKERGDIGKTANFGYWYSGALSDTASKMGWSAEEMWEAVDAYRRTFEVAEEWRKEVIIQGRENGFVTLPDGHRRHRFEASYRWQRLWTDRWEAANDLGLNNFGNLFVKRITSRAGNQLVNSMIQGSCATLAKRSIISINKISDLRFRFLMPIHDELVFSVHRDDVVPFIREAKCRMCDHPDIVQNLILDATASVGRTFEPFHPKKAPLGQIELDEAPEILGFKKDQKLSDPEIQCVVEYLFEKEKVEC